MYQLYLFEDINFDIPATTHRRPRTLAKKDENIASRKDRVDKRNRIMTARYYYWTELKRRRFDDVLKILSDNEFFVEERTISNALVEQDKFLNKLLLEKYNSRKLRHFFPGFDWD